MRPPLLIGDIFTNAARAVPRRLAVSCGDRAMDFAGLEAASNRLARQLVALGIGPGDRVASWTATTVDAVPLFGALAKIGAVFLPLNGLLGAEEVTALVRAGRPAVLVADAGHLAAARSLPVAVLGLEEQLERSTACDPGRLTTPSSVTDAGAHVVFFTSGSTGRPKGVVLSHATDYLRSHPGALPERRGPMVCPYPLFHMGAWTIALQQWQARDAVVLVPPDAGAIVEAVARTGATRLNAVPAVWRRILAHAGDAGPAGELATLEYADSGTSATPPELLEAMAALLPGARLRVFYGSTEAGTVTCLEQPDMAVKPGSCGVPAPGVELRLSGEGEVEVRSTTLFDGYLDDPGATAAALVGGWYRTGDLGELDDEGYLRIVGRTGELIRSGGEAIVPAEVEAVVGELPSVAEVVVVGVPDAIWGEVVCAVVVPAGPSGPSAEEVRAHCRERLAGFKQPRRVELVDALPRTPATGQVQRKLLVERLSAPGA